jgi:integrase
MSDSVHSSLPPTERKPSARPAKPYPEFPLYAHAAGYWAKKIRGRFYYFGPWTDPDGALRKYLEEKDDLHAGRTPRPAQEALTMKDLANAFLNEKHSKVDAGELTQRTWTEYKETTDLLIVAFGKHRRIADLGPEDFSALRKRMAQRWGPVRLGNRIQYVRSVFKFAFESDLIDRPMRFGPSFVKPSAKTLRLHRAKQGPKLFSREEVLRLLDTAGMGMKAMLLLGINCAFGMADCGRLPLSALDLERGWLDFPRVKTGIARRCPLWPKTVAALREVITTRRQPKDAADAQLVFLTAQGNRWHQEDRSGPAVWKFRKLLNALGINGRKGLGFYTLRHTFRTIADEAKDQPAADYIMGHEVPHMSSVYRETISDHRLRAVTDHVRDWLFGSKPESTT